MLYFELIGLAAAKTAVRLFNWHTMPALAIDMVCCSITSKRTVWTLSFILSNSSMQHTPSSLRTKAPLSSTNYLVSGSFLTLAVRPTEVEPRPHVYTLLGAIRWTCWSIWDLAVLGSPKRRTFTYALCCPLLVFGILLPPKSWASIPFLTYLCP